MTRDEGQERRELYQLIVAASDLGAAVSVARFAQEHVANMSSELWQPLHDATVVSYARPFTANRPFGRLPSMWSKFADQRDQELHDAILEQRNTVVAHSDASVRRVLIVPPDGSIGPASAGSKGAWAVTRRQFPPKWFGSVEDLAKSVGARMYEEALRRFNKLDLHQADGSSFDLLTGMPEE